MALCFRLVAMNQAIALGLESQVPSVASHIPMANSHQAPHLILKQIDYFPAS